MTNLSNAHYAFAGKVPDAQPDPGTWAATLCWLGAYQLGRALEQIIAEPVTAQPIDREG